MAIGADPKPGMTPERAREIAQQIPGVCHCDTCSGAFAAAILAAVKPLEQEIARLTRERDNYQAAIDRIVHQRTEIECRADSAEARCKTLEGALKEIVINFGSTKELKKIARAALSPAPAEQTPLFYIQNVGYCGNCLKWWRPDGHGYTLDLNQAWRVTKEKAEEICHSRPQEDIAWPVEQIDLIAHRHVNVEAGFNELKRATE